MTNVVIAYGQRAQTALETGLLEGMGYHGPPPGRLSVPLGRALDHANAFM